MSHIHSFPCPLVPEDVDRAVAVVVTERDDLVGRVNIVPVMNTLAMPRHSLSTPTPCRSARAADDVGLVIAADIGHPATR